MFNKNIKPTILQIIIIKQNIEYTGSLTNKKKNKKIKINIIKIIENISFIFTYNAANVYLRRLLPLV
jgi:hypothetical protein